MEDTNNKKKGFSIVKLLFIFAISIIVLFIGSALRKNDVVLADSGYDFSYDGGGSSYDYGGSSSYDYDYSSSYSGGSYSGGGGSAFSAFVTIVIVIIIIVYVCSKGNGSNVTTVAPAPFRANVNDEDVVNRVKAIIPDFDKNTFLQEGYQIYLDVQNAWTNFALENVRDKISDEMFNMYQSQLATMEVKGEQNIMRGFTKQAAYLKDVVKQNENVTITATYVVDFYDYIVDKATGRVLRGTAGSKFRVTYDMKFRKTLDQSQVVEHCPNCGAKINKINGAGVCEYCGSKVVSENAKWILTDKKNMGQTRL